MRWPIASACASSEPSASRSSRVSTRDRGAASSRAAIVSSRSSSSASFKLLEPALTVSTRMRALAAFGSGRLRTRRRRPGAARPRPVAQLRRVVAMLAGVGAVAQPLIDHVLAQVGGPLEQPRNAVDHVHHEVEAVEVVEHHHVERRGGGALLLVSAHVDAVSYTHLTLPT